MQDTAVGIFRATLNCPFLGCCLVITSGRQLRALIQLVMKRQWREEINIEAWIYLTKIPLTTWAHSFSPTIKCDHVMNNFTESFNAWVGDLRGLPILTLLEGLRRKLIKKL